MERIVNKAKNFKEADDFDIKQQISMSIEERQKVAKHLKDRFYGKINIDVKASRAFSVR